MVPLLVLAAALLPALWLERVSLASLERAQGIWLRALWTLGSLWVGWHEPWLGCLGLGLAIHWQGGPTIHHAIWAGIAGTWFLALSLPAAAWAWLPWAWGAWAWLAAGAVAVQYRRDPAKVRAWWGMRSVTGAYFALILPMLPWWGWPGPLLGLWLTGPSWVAVGALLIAFPVLWPDRLAWGLLGASGLLAAAVGLRWRVWGRALGEWMPRGDSLDSARLRFALLRQAWRDRQWLGIGPGQLGYAHLRAQARGELPTAVGTLHNEPAQLMLEFGVPGLLALAFFCYRVGSRLALSDPWSAAVVAGGVLAFGTMALRVPSIGLVWLLCCAEVAR